MRETRRHPNIWATSIELINNIRMCDNDQQLVTGIAQNNT